MKIKQLDEATGFAFMISQLTHIEKKLYEKQYEEINYDKLIPITNEAGEHAVAIQYFYMEGRGLAKFVGTRAMDIPISELGAKSVTVPVEYGATGYSYSFEEVRQAIFLNRALPQLKADMARKAYEELLQKTAMQGDEKHNLLGFLNNPNVTVTAVIANAGGGQTEFQHKTPDEMLFDINDFMGDIFVESRQVERPNRLLLPTKQWNHLAGTPRSAHSDMTILKWITSNSPYLKSDSDIIPVPELQGAGVAGKDRMVAYNFNADKLKMHVPMPLRFLDLQTVGLGYKVPGEFKAGGVEWMYPGSARFGDGI